MMIQINLLPVRSKKKKRRGPQFATTYILCIILAAGAIGYLWYTSSVEADTLKARQAVLQSEIGKLAKFETMLAQLTKRKELVDKKRGIIQDLQKDRDAIVRILALLSIQVPPEKMWFDRMAQADTTITLDGVALSNEAIVEFMRNLEASPYVEKGSINLVQSKQTTMRNMKLREFQLVYRFLPYSVVKTKFNS